MFAKIKSLIPNWLVNTFWHLPQAVLANLCYRFPSRKLTVIGITGTSGKTTTAHLLYHILDTAGLKVALISTIAAKIGQKEIDIGLHVTNPDSFPLQKLLRMIVNRGYKYVVLEVTSHGLDQHRTWGINFTYAVLTNITHEHLDYHKTFANYQQAKLKLISSAKIAVLNSADQSFTAAKELAHKVIAYRPQSKYSSPRLIGSFNDANIAAAVTVARDLAIDEKTIKKAVHSFPGIPGRMELVQKKPFTVIIDFAHKPDALEKALSAIKLLTPKQGRVIAVFGSAGLRDVKKRPLMGAIAARLADITILTAEDPRTEDVNLIIDQIAAGWQKAKGKQLYRQPDRQQAINLAIKLAQPGDTVALFGKSHEKSMCFGTIEYPWSEHQAVNKALKLKTRQ
jgi:UDP-N-acetylmuramoyl-L-alanyl-D-glutamate--2,6-diaminopimelate ligase